ncbi:DUF2853 family protein [Parvularcula lutaonensis]|uniref:DUF2853 family protein n=1 Tax=Parvularcula lutaonensis TaxID=491923 RepID=A0ABV7M9H0_9PROT|nr:DUF2853 family protein [Parvularcula lutaonensis]GGY47212.1 hypothetical protein GCM10007148_15620 [Parvularcula lutaonensis]
MAGHEEYLEKVRKYDAGADEEHVKKLYNRLRLTISNRDAATVACSDKSELETIRDGFCKKTLGLDAKHSDDEIMDVLKKVCEEMSGDGGNKHRIPFYYLVAKHTNTLDKL